MLEEKECLQIQTITNCMRASTKQQAFSMKYRHLSTVIKNSVITFNKNKNNTALIQYIDEIKELSQQCQGKSLLPQNAKQQEKSIKNAASINRAIKTSFVPEKSILLTVGRFLVFT